MPESPAATSAVTDFIHRWEISGAAERANYQLFLSEFCDLLEVPRPEPTRPDDRENAYVFERNVCFRHGDGSSSIGRIDLYRRGHFVCEAKQGSDQPGERSPLAVREEGARWPATRRGTAVRGTRGWDQAMLQAKGQAEQYARALPVDEGWPPFLVVVDVGHAIELYSEFSQTGKAYLPFPGPRSHRILLSELQDDAVRQRLRLVWSDPHALDPAKHSARVTRQVADRLALLAKSLERKGHSAKEVGNFLKRCLFTMFAEDIGLIPLKGFTDLLESLRGRADTFAPMAESLWATMKDGGFSTVLREKLLRFNGGLFEEARALPIGEEQLALLIDAGKADWRDVEPAIFGTLLERALDPLRADWEAVLVAAVTLDRQGDSAGAVETVRGFHRKLCQVRILDPACGSGNFLYVTFEHLKRLEGEVLNALEGFGDEQADLELAGLTVDPHQLLGLEVNPRAAAITDLVLWIGYLQWHFRTRGHVMPPEPVIRKFRNVECRDAVLAYDATEPVLDSDGNPVTRWDGHTTKTHPVTGEQVPDEAAQEPLLRYLNPRRAEWPEADFVVGNPPFLGAATMRRSLGDGYAEALRAAWKDVPDSADFVMFWWQRAAELTRTGKLRRFGFITTNSLRQAFNRRVLQQHLTGKPALSLAFAIPDHPWVDSADGAAVRIAMTVGRPATEGTVGTLATVTTEREGNGEGITVDLAPRRGVLHADLTAGANVAGAGALRANSNISSRGVMLFGAGFIVHPDEAAGLGLGRVAGLERHIRPYRNGRDLTASPRDVLVIDLFGLAADEVRDRFPEVYQWLLERVKPEREQNRDKPIKENWWLFGRTRSDFRPALSGLPRYVATVETAKHRTFQFLEAAILPDNMLVAIASDDAFVLGVLSSRLHVVWGLAAGGTLEDRPRYNKTRCFEPFPFPDAGDEQKQKVHDLAERLDAHRKRQQELHPGLGLTEMYNVLEKLRAGEALSAKDKAIHEKGLVSVLRQLHDELDAAVAGAYGWPADLPEEEILERLVALNAERAREEAQGVVRWLRPEYQAPQDERPAVQTGLELAEEETTPAAIPTVKAPWPKNLPEQVQAVRAVLAAADGPITAETMARSFQRARADKVSELLITLATLGQAREVEPGSYAC